MLLQSANIKLQLKKMLTRREKGKGGGEEGDAVAYLFHIFHKFFHASLRLQQLCFIFESELL